jgi:hypothetical protein
MPCLHIYIYILKFEREKLSIYSLIPSILSWVSMLMTSFSTRFLKYDTFLNRVPQFYSNLLAFSFSSCCEMMFESIIMVVF